MNDKTTLAFGLRDLPDDLTCAWGARWIWPDDLLHDRQDTFGPDDEQAAVIAWLTRIGLHEARTKARELAREHAWSPGDDNTVTLYEDEAGIVRGNPQGSHGYVYVAAWLKSPAG